ncbi:hypothetical protein [Coleofasciculus sp.]
MDTSLVQVIFKAFCRVAIQLGHSGLDGGKGHSGQLSVTSYQWSVIG